MFYIYVLYIYTRVTQTHTRFGKLTLRLDNFFSSIILPIQRIKNETELLWFFLEQAFMFCILNK